MTTKDTATIDKEIKAIATMGAKLDARIQACGVDVLEHFGKHKDNGLVNRLYLALPKGARKTAMASWLLAYGALQANTDPKTKNEQPFVYDAKKSTDPLKAAQDPWYDHKPDKSPDEIFDLQKAIKMVIAKAGKATSMKGGDVNTLKALARAVNIPEKELNFTTPSADVKEVPAT